MIVVIADDLTGAAELGGIGLRYGLRVRLSATVDASSKPDLLVVYTDTRSMTETDAVETMRKLTAEAKALRPWLFYKKTDSVLRGHVVAETRAQMDALGFGRALLVPANPVLGRTVKNGHYFVNDQPVHQTDFATDPEFPVKTSAVKEMLGNAAEVATAGAELSEGLFIGEAETVSDVEAWANRKHEGVLLGGAASFFSALLNARYAEVETKRSVTLLRPLLLVSGTTFRKSIEQRAAFSPLVSEMPKELFRHSSVEPALAEEWAAEIKAKLNGYGQAIAAVGTGDGAKADPLLLREKVSRALTLVLRQAPVAELLIEGGSTAYAAIQALGISRFTPVNELAQGVVRMKVEGARNLHLTIKPGSYPWPDEWNFR